MPFTDRVWVSLYQLSLQTLQDISRTLSGQFSSCCVEVKPGLRDRLVACRLGKSFPIWRGGGWGCLWRMG